MSAVRGKRRKTDDERDTARQRKPRGHDQGIRKDQRGQEQPADKKRAQENR